MHIVYTTEEPPSSFTKSLFLAGPSPRSSKVKSWREDALRILTEMNYDGVVFVPESRTGEITWSYKEQVTWEWATLEMADSVLFWVPRNARTLPGYTTNIEFGLWAKSGKAVFGAPPRAFKVKYLRHMCEKLNIPQFRTLEDTIGKSLEYLGVGALRQDAERQIPLHVWDTRTFQDWYQAQKDAGNRLDGAKVEWVFRVGPKRNIVYTWALHVNVYITKENRNKRNEFILSRPDISTVVMFYRGISLFESYVVLIREFRSPARTPDGLIRETPGGSSNPRVTMLEVALSEVEEETGFRIDSARIKKIGSRQLAGTFSTHKAYVWCLELTEEELLWFKTQEGIVRGTSPEDPSGERTYVEVRRVRDILSEELTDWSTLGMILAVLTDER